MPEGTQTTQSTNNPWKPAQPLLKRGLNAASNQFKKGPFNKSMVVPYSQQSKDAFGNLSGIADANSNGQGLSGQAQGIINNGGFNDQQSGVLKDWRSQIDTPYSMNEDSANVLKALQRDTMGAADLGAAAAGRYGSGIHQGRRTQDVADVSSQFRMSDYQNDLSRKDAIRSNLFNGANAGLANMQSAYGALQSPEQTRLGVGGAMEDLNRRKLDDRARRANLPWDQIGRLMNVGNLGGQYQTTTTQAPAANPFLQALGGVGTAGNLLFGSSPGGLLGARPGGLSG